MDTYVLTQIESGRTGTGRVSPSKKKKRERDRKKVFGGVRAIVLVEWRLSNKSKGEEMN